MRIADDDRGTAVLQLWKQAVVFLAYRRCYAGQEHVLLRLHCSQKSYMRLDRLPLPRMVMDTQLIQGPATGQSGCMSDIHKLFLTFLQDQTVSYISRTVYFPQDSFLCISRLF